MYRKRRAGKNKCSESVSPNPTGVSAQNAKDQLMLNAMTTLRRRQKNKS
jgi:hypothetical protein